MLRVRYREVTGSELLIAGGAGRLDDTHLNEEGQRFTAAFYPAYLDDFRATFGGCSFRNACSSRRNGGRQQNLGDHECQGQL